MAPGIRQSGFSLLELILVIVLLGVLASGAGLLITKPIEAYNDQLRRQRLVDQAEMALRQIARDVRRALPNSIRLDTTTVAAGWALEMINTIDGARYRDDIDNVGGDFTDPADRLDFTIADTDFNLLGTFSGIGNGVLPVNQRIVVYNTAATDIYLDINAGIGSGIVTSSGTTLTVSTDVSGIDDEHHINMSPGFRFTQQSPGQRAFVIDSAISYVCNPGTRTITRYDNYPYQTIQQGSEASLGALSGVQSGRVVTQIASCAINYDPGTASRGGIISLRVSLDDTSTNERISLLHQIHVVNVP